MKTFIKKLQQLDQKALPNFCDEGVYRIVVNIYLKCPNKFKMLVPGLGGFHMAKCVQHCIGKYIWGSGLDNTLVRTQVFGKKFIEQVLNKYWISVERYSLYLIVESNNDSVNRLKWDTFCKSNKKEKYKEMVALLETFYFEVTKPRLHHVSILLRHTKYDLQNWKTILLDCLMRMKNYRCASISTVDCILQIYDRV